MANAYIETRHWPTKNGQPAPTLVITYEALRDLLQNESAVLDPNDVPGLCEAIAERIRESKGSEAQAVDAWVEKAQADIDELDEEAAEEDPQPSLWLGFFLQYVRTRDMQATLASARKSLYEHHEREVAQIIWDAFARAGCQPTVIEADEEVTAETFEHFLDRFDRKDLVHELDNLIEWHGPDCSLDEFLPTEVPDGD